MFMTLVSILPIFLLIVSGYVMRNHVYSEDSFWKTVESMTYYVFFPSLLILHVSGADFGAVAGSSILVGVVIGVTLMISIVTFLFRHLLDVSDELFTSIFQGSTRYNSYVFLGLSLALYGAQGVAICGVFIAYMIIFTNALNVIVLNVYGSSNKKSAATVAINLAKNPLIVGSLVGLVLNMLHIRIGGPLSVYMEYLAGAASPLSLLAVGAGLRLSSARSNLSAVVLSSSLKLLAMPLVTYLIISHLQMGGTMPAKIALLYACLPTAGNAYILARQMGGDAEAMASIITVTTLGSALSSLLFIGLV